MKRVLGFIGARGGSKGIPRKNIRSLCGKPLIAYAIEAALAAKHITRCVVSTDDLEIMRVARQFRADVPFQRPAALATDQAMQIDAIIHAVETLREQGDEDYDVIAVIQPTAPLRTAADIDAALDHMLATKADSVYSVSPIENAHPYLMCKLDEDRPVPFIGRQGLANNRQAYEPAYIRNGAIYAVDREVLLGKRSLMGDDCRAVVMPAERSINLDSKLDWQFAEMLLGSAGSSVRAA